MKNQSNYKYEIALSFAGEDREYVKEIAACLKMNGVKVFFDEFNETELWGKDLYVYLDKIYRKDSQYCIMFLSEHYAKKLWTNHERKSVQARAFQEHQEYILPIKLDDTEIPGIRPTLGYLDGRRYKPSEICKRVLSKLRSEPVESDTLEDDPNIPLVKRKISESEKNNFLVSAFEKLKINFQSRLKKLSNKNKHIIVNFDDRANNKFTVSVKTDDFEIGCKIWYGRQHSRMLNIFYSESYKEAFHSNSYNDSAHVEDDGFEMYFNILGLLFGSLLGIEAMDLKHASTQDLINYFWSRFISNLNIYS